MFDFRNINSFYTYLHLRVEKIIYELQNIRDFSSLIVDRDHLYPKDLNACGIKILHN